MRPTTRPSFSIHAASGSKKEISFLSLPAVRLTGRVGTVEHRSSEHQYGGVRPAEAFATNFSVLRFKRNVFRKSAIGVIGTLRSPDG